jgi:hypothetical protein
MTLAANAIITVQQYLDFTGQTMVLSDAFTIYNSSGSYTSATVQVTDTTLVLVSSGGGTDTFTFANAAHDTMAELTAAITALAESWQVELLCGGTTATGGLISMPATDVLGQAKTLRLQYANTSIIDDWINAASTAIETYLQSVVIAQTDLRRWVSGRGDPELVLADRPVTAVKRIAGGEALAFTVRGTTTTDLRATVEVQDTLVRCSRVASTGTETATSFAFSTYTTASDLVTAIAGTAGWTATLVENCMSLDLHRRAGMDALGVDVSATFPDTSAAVRHVNEGAGIVSLLEAGMDTSEPSRHNRGRYNYLVQYDAGYAAASVPQDIVTACWMLAQKLQQARGRDTSLQSESLGQYSYSRFADPVYARTLISGDIAGLLEPYRNRGY